MTNTLLKTLSEALSDICEREVGTITETTRFDRDFDLDSYMFVQFLLSLEDRLPGLRFEPEAIGQADFNNASGLISYIDSQLLAAQGLVDA
ncbi:acyl carrier protein [Phaeobacter sp. HF9A]|uniref:acyl carrier protein n=1 Tax=Phaeobacter sp. HF9A TaxID=2721561 RepID=UPI0014312F72|nr:acyl carrier protein [Phaeobacter sp. HF9A]NIZ12589.1 acyl carrier protein [Phaeobacter sp. HF9A]